MAESQKQQSTAGNEGRVPVQKNAPIPPAAHYVKATGSVPIPPAATKPTMSVTPAPAKQGNPSGGAANQSGGNNQGGGQK